MAQPALKDGGPYRLYRDPGAGWVAGICAGMGEYFGLSAGLMRLLWLLGLMMFFLPVVIAYAALAMTVPVRPPRLYSNPHLEDRHRAIHLGPRRALADVRLRFREVEQKLAGLEAVVVGEEFQLRRKFRDLQKERQ